MGQKFSQSASNRRVVRERECHKLFNCYSGAANRYLARAQNSNCILRIFRALQPSVAGVDRFDRKLFPFAVEIYIIAAKCEPAETHILRSHAHRIHFTRKYNYSYDDVMEAVEQVSFWYARRAKMQREQQQKKRIEMYSYFVTLSVSLSRSRIVAPARHQDKMQNKTKLCGTMSVERIHFCSSGRSSECRK